MSDNVRVSFIPKEPLAQGRGLQRERPVVGVSLVIALIVVSISMLGAVGLLVWKHVLNNERLAKLAALEEFNRQISQGKDKELIESAQALREQIELTRTILNQHRAQTAVFRFLERVTPASAAYASFGLESEDQSSVSVKVNLKGVAPSYEAIAYFSSVLDQEEMVTEYQFAKLSLNEEDGTVTFSLSLTFAPEFIAYKNVISNGTPPVISSPQ